VDAYMLNDKCDEKAIFVRSYDMTEKGKIKLKN
jgi:hypothetical protein